MTTDTNSSDDASPSSDDSDADRPSPVNAAEHVDGETPLVVLPRGGAREVGRSCYHVETRQGTYLVDCGLNQGSGGQFADFRGLEPESIDAVFLTHAHIDHSGGLPVLEHRNLLAPNAKIICTQGTAALTHVLLHDSLKIHESEAKKPGRERHFTRTDVEDVLARFDPLSGYGSGRVTDHVGIHDEDLQYEFGDAGHLLGSAWLTLESGGRRVCFSGDLGGRSAHLHDIQTPPGADTLILESTYGDRDTHNSFQKARTELFETAIDAIERGIPVLIPTFAVGRAQEILQIFRERWRNLPEETREKLHIVYDGMATEATDRYHAYASPEYVNDSVMNYMENAADFEPFVPEIAERPSNADDRRRILDQDTAPIVVSPSGMLTGGLSPAYLLELVENYDEARILFTGYQAPGTPGHDLQQADGDTATVTVNAWPITSEREARETDGDGPPEYTFDVPTDWIHTVSGMSGHAARNTLLQFARDVDANHVALVHGDPENQRSMVNHLEGNLSADLVTRAAVQSVIPVHPPDEGLVAIRNVHDVAHPSIEIRTESETDSSHLTDALTGDSDDGTEAETANEPPSDELDAGDEDEKAVEERVSELVERVSAVDRELAAQRNDDGWSEGELREVIREEIESALDDRGIAD
ncbi:MBL fold metallo-hydrolase (plasmid) [Halorussus vallis]|uniref:MBL fold metallo-hydrolase n=1 Tax=Halorussus vallis TaxID=2953749 RepID=UPI00209FB8BC|nr:MBL fold metallo-hydrolase [Halorussus vallis]USZ78730.1 MBL fold metallo-hydrolase [Halorussus vallis]